MSAPVSHDPLVVNTRDGVCWERRAVTPDGRGLYAVEGSCKCPEFVMATLAELAEHGIVGSAYVLPVPVGPEPRTLDKVEDELTGANLSLWEEEQENARLRLALKSAQRGRRELRAQVAALLSERHSTNESLDDAVQTLRERESGSVDRSAVLDDFIARCEVALSGCCSECDAAIAIVKGRKQAALDNAPVPEQRLLSGEELRNSLSGHLFGGAS